MSMDDRRLFLALVDAGSFAATARQLDLARSTVMRRVEALEGELGVTLVHRAGRSVVPTEAGMRLAEGLRGVFRTLDRIEEDVRSSDGTAAGTVRVWLPALGASFGMVNAAAKFALQHPQIQLRLDLGRSQRAPAIGAFDVLLQLGHRHNPDLRARTLFRDRLLLAASPAYLERHGVPASVEALADHVAVEQRDPSGRVMAWRRPDGSRVRMPRAAVSTHTFGFVYEFTLNGVGIGRVARSFAREALADGRLRQVLPELVVEEPITLVYLPDPSPTTRAFLDFMAKEAATFGGQAGTSRIR